MTPAALLRAAHRVARRLGYARRPLLQVAHAEIDRGAHDWHAWRLERAAVRVALGAVLYVLAGGQYAWAASVTWVCGRQADVARHAAWLAQKAPERRR